MLGVTFLLKSQMQIRIQIQIQIQNSNKKTKIEERKEMLKFSSGCIPSDHPGITNIHCISYS